MMFFDEDFDYKKFKQVLHYIIDRTTTFDNVGKIVIYKLLYFADFNFYELFEEKLTGEIYSKLPHGPAPRHFEEIVKELKDEKKIEERKNEYYGRNQIKYLSLKRPELSLLTGEEIRHLDDTLCRYGTMNGSQIEALSHKDTPWQIATEHKNLDYEMVFYRSPDMSIREYMDD